MEPQLFDRLRENVAAGELPAVVDELLALTSGWIEGRRYSEAVRSQRNALIGIRSDYVMWRREVAAGATGGRDSEGTHARIRARLLMTLDDLEVMQRAYEAPVDEPRVRIDAEKPALEKVWGRNNLKSIFWLEVGLSKASAVCRIRTHDGAGTGFVVGRGVVMTNNHVIPSQEVARSARAEFNFEENSEGLKPVTSYELEAELFVTHAGELDCTIVGVREHSSRPPLSHWGVLSLSASQAAIVGDHVTIIQHPKGGLKQIGITDNSVVNIYEHRLQYMTDTMPGSSGAPVFNDRWEVIALHHAGGQLLKNSNGETLFGNEGILISYILAEREFRERLVTA